YKAGYSRDSMTNDVKRGIEQGLGWDRILQIVTMNGKEKWRRTSGRQEIENGEVVKLIGSFQDAEQQKQLLDKLTETEQKYHAVFENLPEAKVLLYKNEIILDANQSFLNNIGYSKTAIINTPFALLTFPPVAFKKNDQHPEQHSITLLHKDGHTV